MRGQIWARTWQTVVQYKANSISGQQSALVASWPRGGLAITSLKVPFAARYPPEVEKDNEEKFGNGLLGRISKHVRFEQSTVVVVIFNALVIGWDADYSARWYRPENLYEAPRAQSRSMGGVSQHVPLATHRVPPPLGPQRRAEQVGEHLRQEVAQCKDADAVGEVRGTFARPRRYSRRGVTPPAPQRRAQL